MERDRIGKRQLPQSTKLDTLCNKKRRNIDNNSENYEDMVRHLPDIEIKKVVGTQQSTENIIKPTQFVLYLQDTPSNASNQNQNSKVHQDKVLHILKEDAGEQSNDFIIHRLTLSQIMRKFNLITKSSHNNNNNNGQPPCELWVYCHPSNISSVAMQQCFSTLKTYITRLTLIQSDGDKDSNNNNGNSNVTVQDLLKTLQILHEKLEYLEFSGYMCITIPAKINLAVPVSFPILTKLKTLLCGKQKPGTIFSHHFEQQEEDYKFSKSSTLQNGFIIHKLLTASPNLTRIENYPLHLPVGHDQNSFKELDINLLVETKLIEAVKSFYIDEGLKSGEEQRLVANSLRRLKIKHFKVNLTHLKIFSWFTTLQQENRLECNKIFDKLIRLNLQTIESLEIQPLDSFAFSPIKIPQLKKLKRLTFVDDEMKQTRFFEEGGNMDPFKLFPNLKTVKLDLNLPLNEEEASNLLENCYFPKNSFFSFPVTEDSDKYRTFETVKTLELSKYIPESCLKQIRYLFPHITKLDLTLDKMNWNLNQVIQAVPFLWPSLTQFSLHVEFQDLTFIPVSLVTKFLPSMKKLKVIEFCIGLPQENNVSSKQPLWISSLVKLLHSGLFPELGVNLFCDWNRSNKNIQDFRNLFAKLMCEPSVIVNF